jgi:hypothetical protein
MYVSGQENENMIDNLWFLASATKKILPMSLLNKPEEQFSVT